MLWTTWWEVTIKTPEMLAEVVRTWDRVHKASPFIARVAITAGANVGLALLGLVTGVLAARLLGPEGRGELAAIQTWPSFIATIAMLGLPEALVYHCARNLERAGSYLGSAVTMALLASVPFMVLGHLAMPLLLSAQSAEIVRSAQWYLLLVPVIALVGMPYHPLRGFNKFGAWNSLRVAPSLAWLVVLLGAWTSGWTKPALLAFAYLGLLTLLFFPIAAVVSRRVPAPFWPDVRDWRSLLRYGLPVMGSSLPQMLNLRLDQMLMMTFLPGQAIGLYVVGVAWSGGVQPLVNAVGSVLLPKIASRNDGDAQAQAFIQGTHFGVLLSAFVAVLLLAMTPWMIPLLFGHAFSAAIPAALVLVVATAIASINGIIEEGLKGLGHPAAVLWAELGGLVVTALTLTALLQPLGILGAAVSSLLGHSVVTVGLAAQARRFTGCSRVFFLPNVSQMASGWQRIKISMSL